MWISDSWQDFAVLDCSRGEKLERWGKYTLVRPDPQAIWDTPRTDPRWRTADGRYSRSHTGGGSWDKRTLPPSWDIRYRDLTFRVKPMNFKHTGIFPEQAANWDWFGAKIREAGSVWAVPVIDLNSISGLYPVADSHVRYFSDGQTDRLHPNAAGHERMAKALAYQLLAFPACFD